MLIGDLVGKNPALCGRFQVDALFLIPLHSEILDSLAKLMWGGCFECQQGTFRA